MNISSVLHDLGMSENKAAVYLACLELGVATATQIAQKAQIQRTTVYEILEDLQSEGLISSTPKVHTTLYCAEPPDQLKAMLREKEKRVEQVMPDLRLRYNVGETKPKARFYEGPAGIKTVFADTMTVKSGVLKAFLSVKDVNEFIGFHWFAKYTADRIKSGAKLEVIRPESKEIAGVFPSSHKDNRELRIAPRGMVFGMSQYLYDNKVALISTAKEGYGMIIESEEYYKLQLNLFSTLWDVSRITKWAD